MAVYHRTQRLQIYGEKPEVTQLFGDRYRMVVRCKAARDTEAWYNANKDQIFASFGTLYSAQMSVDGIDPRSGEAYPDMCLVSNGASYTQTGEYVISFVYETLTAAWTKEQDDEVTSTDNGLRVLERSEVAKITATAPYDEDDVGVATITDGGKTLYLAGFKDQTGVDNDSQVGRVVTRWAEPGILNTQREFARDGLLYVTFESQGTKFTPTALNPTYDLTDEDILAFQNGAAANLFRSRTRNVEGFKRYVVTVMLKQDGTPLTDDGTDNEVNSYQRYLPYQKPGTFTLAADSIEASPGIARFALAQITELFSTSGNLAASYKPYSIANWANYNYSYVPTATGIAVVKNGGAKGYLGSGSFASSGGKVFGTDVDSAAGSAGSDPSPSVFNALNNQVMDSDNAPAFVTDEGVKWYRKMKVQMVGTMAANLGSV